MPVVVLAVGPVALVVAPVLEPVPEAAELEPAAAELVQERAALAAAVLHTSNVAARWCLQSSRHAQRDNSAFQWSRASALTVCRSREIEGPSLRPARGKSGLGGLVSPPGPSVFYSRLPRSAPISNASK
ncbi:hypothetical protein ACVWXN_000262 [Bradyrhizobium sp. i1.4.4]